MIALNPSMWHKVLLFLFGVITGLLAAGLVILISGQPRGSPIQLPPLPSPAPLYVHVSGEVALPGAYTLPPGSRVTDALQAAGGFTDQADPASINLAATIMDGQQIYISSVGEVTKPIERSAPIGMIHINTATIEQLVSLPGIGEVTAQAIIDYRDKHGPFSEMEDILFVDGIGPAKLEEIRPFLIIP